jgi:GTP diphosphokinase / guanosine-3',5'-bis(diphosphate) 3'-diphosphatase
MAPVPGRIKDFIAIPRPNLYQSLHTSVVGPEGKHFEIQIRTEEMHRIAEEGIAAHWKYKEGKRGVQDDQRVAWLRQLVEWQQDMRDPGEFMSTLKVDLYPEEVYCFTPKGRVIVLPAGPAPSISPTPCTPKSATPAPAPRSTAASCRCATCCATATSSMS